MGRRLETIKLAGKVFTIKSKPVDEPHYNSTRWNTLKLLGECYDKPSHAKIDINRDWLHWMFSVNNEMVDLDAFIEQFGIISYNIYRFNYGGIIIIDGVRYVIDITSSHNYLWRIA